ncbi:MAG: arsenate reductase ArsC [Thermoguttaceae bacterium]|jgi:arsenate reductase
MSDSSKQSKKLKILFLCTGNSCRSQMAEAWTRELIGDRIDAFSAGIETRGLDPDAVKAMAEAGVNINGQRSKHVNELRDVDFDYVVTVCDHARENCPIIPGKAKVIHAGFDDPPYLAAGARTEEERLAPYRRVRDEIREFVKNLPSLIEEWSAR